MTFSESDLLPYQQVAIDGTAEALKTILMQHTILHYGLLEEHSCLVMQNHFNNKISEVPALTPSYCYADFYFYSNDFAAVFHQTIDDADHESKRRGDRLHELGRWIVFLQRPEQAETLVHVDEILSDELRGMPIPEKSWVTQSIFHKAYQLALIRFKNKYREIQSRRYFSNNHVKEFKVCLIRLVGLGRGTRETNLYFHYTTPFHEFERALREHTQLCIIPRPTLEEGFISPDSQRFSTVDAPTPATEPDTYEAFSTTWVKAKITPSRAEKGYTVKDGPWVCRITSRNPQDQKEDKNVKRKMSEKALGDLSISNEDSYEVMKRGLAALNKKEPENCHFIQIMHSKERDYSEAFNKKHANDREQWRKLDKNKGEIPEEDEDGMSSETYLEWLSRTRQL